MSTAIRQTMGCGYEPRLADAQAWTPPFLADRGDRVTTCPGYTIDLPMVSEIVEAYPQWEQGTLTDYLGAPPSDVALTCLTWFRAGIREHESATIKAATKKGGGA